MKRETISSLLYDKKLNEVTELAVNDRKVLRILFTMLYDEDDYLHWCAADAIGRYSNIVSKDDSEKVRELIRRLLWNLNEECGSSPFGSVEAIGAIIAEDVRLFSNYISIIFPFHEDESLCPGLLWAYGRLGEIDRALLTEYIPFLLSSLKHQSPLIRAYAVWVLGQIQYLGAEVYILELVNDKTLINFYEYGGRYRRVSVGEIAKQALQKIKS